MIRLLCSLRIFSYATPTKQTPKPIPPAQKYKIELFNEKLSFEILTYLRLERIEDNGFILSNKESENEEFDVVIKFDNFNKTTNNYKGKFNITISLREKYKYDCKLNKEMLKFIFIGEDKNNCLFIKNVNLDSNVFETYSNGTEEKTEEDYRRFNKILSLIDKVIFLSKIKNIKIKYDINYFLQKEELINLIYNDINRKKYIIRKEMKSCINFESEINIDELNESDGKLAYKSEMKELELFGYKFELQRSNMIMFECKISKIFNNRKIELKSKHIEFYTEEELKNMNKISE